MIQLAFPIMVAYSIDFGILLINMVYAGSESSQMLNALGLTNMFELTIGYGLG